MNTFVQVKIYVTLLVALLMTTLEPSRRVTVTVFGLFKRFGQAHSLPRSLYGNDLPFAEVSGLGFRV